MRLPFVKYNGTGNDFIVIDNRKNIFSSLNKNQISNLCNRNFGIGADGIILIQDDEDSDFNVIYYNSDGNIGTFCGNGSRCAVHYSKLIGMLNHEPKFKFHDEIYTAEVNENLVSIHFPNIKNWQIKDDNIFINTGSPHHVLFKEDIGFIDVNVLGKKLCENSIFTVEHTNVNFVSINNEKSISVRTYERGVNAETLSCGTGVVASVLSSDINNYISNKEILVKTKGGDIIVSFNKKNEYYENIIMSGKVQNVYSGIINL